MTVRGCGGAGLPAAAPAVRNVCCTGAGRDLEGWSNIMGCGYVWVCVSR